MARPPASTLGEAQTMFNIFLQISTNLALLSLVEGIKTRGNDELLR